MIKQLLSLLSLFILGTTIQAQTPYPMEESSLLWKIEGKGLKQESYLFGTMHLIEKDKFYFPKKLEKTLTKCERLVMELPGLPNQLEALKYVQLEEGTFFDFFTKEQTDSILLWAKEQFGFSEESFRKSFEGMKPFTIVQLATQMHFMGKTESYEMTFEELARANKMKIDGLETIGDQMKIFDDLSSDQQTELVMESVRNPTEGIEVTKMLTEIYLSQQIDSMYMMILDEGGVLAEEQNNFLDNRNKAWIPKIEAFIEEKKSFIAVGAGHLGGPRGVIRLLEEKGYTVTPIKL